MQNTLRKHTNKQSCSKPNAIIHAGQSAMEIHVSPGYMFEDNVLPWVHTGLFPPQGKYTRKYWCYLVIYRVAAAEGMNSLTYILFWTWLVRKGTHLRTTSLPKRCVLKCTPLPVTILNVVTYAKRMPAGTLRWFRYWTSHLHVRPSSPPKHLD